MVFQLFKQSAVPVERILSAFQLHRDDLHGKDPLWRKLGYDYGVVKGDPFEGGLLYPSRFSVGFRKAVLEATTNELNEREIRLSVDHVNARGITVERLADVATLIIKPPVDDLAQVVTIKRSTKDLGDAWRKEQFFATVTEWRTHFEKHPELGQVRPTFG